jgi:hypothetical protein
MQARWSAGVLAGFHEKALLVKGAAVAAPPRFEASS